MIWDKNAASFCDIILQGQRMKINKSGRALTEASIRNALDAHEGQATWAQNRDYVELHYHVNNFLTGPRRQLQKLINAGVIERVGGPHVESYRYK